MALEEAKLEMKRKYEKGVEEARKSTSQYKTAKLPKLVIYNLDWRRFWRQFEIEIDKRWLKRCENCVRGTLCQS